jgi:hypothetical protein
MIAVLGDAFFGVRSSVFANAPAPEAVVETLWQGLDEMPRKREEIVRALEPEMSSIAMLTDANGKETNRAVFVEGGQAYINVAVDSENTLRAVALPDEALPENTEAVGLALVAKFPASLELAGVILLMAMFGAVVLARRQFELGEDERREAAGMSRLTPDDHPVGEPGGSA